VGLRPWNDLGTTIPRRGNFLTTWIARALLKLFGWRMEGTLPDLPKMVMAAGPHTSNWDFLVGVGAMYSAGFKVSFLAKDSLFRPPLGWIMRWLGGRPVDRSAAHGLVAESVRQIGAADKFILALVIVDGEQHEGPFYLREPFTQEPDWAVTSINLDLEQLLARAALPEAPT